MATLALVFIYMTPAQTSAQETAYLGGPPPGEVPLEVRVGFSVVNITSVNEQGETIDFDGTILLEWVDPRLAHDPASVGSPDFVPGDYSRAPRRIYQGDYAVQEVFPGWRPHLIIPNGIGDRQTTGRAIGVWPDGRVMYMETFRSMAETPMNMRRFPFDRQRLEVFVHPLTYAREEIVLVPDDRLSHTWNQNMGIAQWAREGTSIEERAIEVVGRDGSVRVTSEAVLNIEIRRRPGHVLIKILFPLVLLVCLTWVVFWMDEESISNRVNISFIGILSVVAYYFVILGNIPEISYLTLMDGFIIATFLILAAGVVVNVVVDKLNRAGRKTVGDRVDRICRWAFPVGYALISLLVAAVFFNLA